PFAATQIVNHLKYDLYPQKFYDPAEKVQRQFPDEKLPRQIYMADNHPVGKMHPAFSQGHWWFFPWQKPQPSRAFVDENFAANPPCAGCLPHFCVSRARIYIRPLSFFSAMRPLIQLVSSSAPSFR